MITKDETKPINTDLLAMLIDGLLMHKQKEAELKAGFLAVVAEMRDMNDPLHLRQFHDLLATEVTRRSEADKDLLAMLSKLQDRVGVLEGKFLAREHESGAQVPHKESEPHHKETRVKTCQTCLWWSGKICNRDGSPNAHKHVGAGWTCEQYVFTNKPRDGLIEQVGEPKHGAVEPEVEPELEEEAEILNPWKKTIPTRAKCDSCGHTITVRKNEYALYPHDVNGRTYKGCGKSGADKSNPCPGKPVKEGDAQQ